MLRSSKYYLAQASRLERATDATSVYNAVERAQQRALCLSNARRALAVENAAQALSDERTARAARAREALERAVRVEHERVLRELL